MFQVLAKWKKYIVLPTLDPCLIDNYRGGIRFQQSSCMYNISQTSQKLVKNCEYLIWFAGYKGIET